MGNLILGWNSYFVPLLKEKVNIFHKDKIFSQSSVGSVTNKFIPKIEDSDIIPFEVHKFRQVKKLKGKPKKKSKKIKKNYS